MTKIAHTMGVLSLAAFTASAFGGTTATATIDNFRIQLIDLDPNDGIAPAIKFDDGSFLQYSALADGFGSSDGSGGYAFAPFAQVSTNAARGAQTASAALAGDVFGAGASITLSASTGSTAPVASGVASIDFGTPTGYYGFTLTPQTRILFLGDANTTASTDFLGQSDSGQARIEFGTFADGAIDTTGDGAFLWANVGAVAHDAQSQQLDVTLANASGQSLHGEVRLAISAEATTYAPVVVLPTPEPNAALLPLLGFGWLALRARRRGAARA